MNQCVRRKRKWANRYSLQRVAKMFPFPPFKCNRQTLCSNPLPTRKITAFLLFTLCRDLLRRMNPQHLWFPIVRELSAKQGMMVRSSLSSTILLPKTTHIHPFQRRRSEQGTFLSKSTTTISSMNLLKNGKTTLRSKTMLLMWTQRFCLSWRNQTIMK